MKDSEWSDSYSENIIKLLNLENSSTEKKNLQHNIQHDITVEILPTYKYNLCKQQSKVILMV